MMPVSRYLGDRLAFLVQCGINISAHYMHSIIGSHILDNIYVMGSIQTCTLVGYRLKFCAIPGFDTIGFRTIVTKHVTMQGLGASHQALTSSRTFG